MSEKEMFEGFDPEKQTHNEKYIINRYGDKAKAAIKEAKLNS